MQTSSQLLISEPARVLLPSLATALNGNHDTGGNRNGVSLALFLQQVQYHLAYARATKGKFGRVKDGRYWIYKSMGEWKREHTYFSEETIERLVAALVEGGFLLVEKEGTGRYTKTWYTIDYDRLDALVTSYKAQLLPSDEECSHNDPNDETQWDHNDPIQRHNDPIGREPLDSTEIPKTPPAISSRAQREGLVIITTEEQIVTHMEGDEDEEASESGSDQSQLEYFLRGQIGRKSRFDQGPRNALSRHVEYVDPTPGATKRATGPSPIELFETDPQYRRWIEEALIPARLNSHAQAKVQKPIGQKEIVEAIRNYNWFYRWSAEHPAPTEEFGMEW
jgi:hypothetical protein